MKSKWAYGRSDGEDLGEYTWMTDDSEDGAKGLAADHVANLHGWDGSINLPEMVVWEMVPRWIGTPKITSGEDLGDGDKEPDEFDRLVWVRGGSNE